MTIADHPSPNHGERIAEGADAVVVDMLVIHYTGMIPDARALAWLCDPKSQVSAHYFIDEAGTVCRLVPEARRAWHAGISAWRGARDINSRSIGIELANPGHDFGYRDFPAAQIEALIDLAGGILHRHPIPARNVVGHSDIAPARKLDPGERFPWRRLADAGIGAWPAETEAGEARDISAMLAAYGYGIEDTPLQQVICAFQRHFRPQRLDGIADAQTCARLASLLSAVAGAAASA